MRRLAHLSDLHFGRDRPELLGPLIEAVNAARPDVIAISGDLTQRARDHQFRDARAFVEQFEAPCVVVPGNHDIPLDNAVARLLNPWGRYRAWFGKNLEPEYRDAEMIVLGVNTVNPLSWQRGWIARRALRRIRRAFEPEPEARNRIVVAHHPFEHLPGERKALMRGARDAIDALAACGADIVLTGHLHAWRAGAFAKREGRAGVIQIQAGTGLSTRLRGEENDFNLLTLSAGEVMVERFVAEGGATRFTATAAVHFRTGTQGWAPSGAPET